MSDALQPQPRSTRAVLFLLAENRLLRETLLRILAEKIDLRVAGAISASPGVIDLLAASKPEIILLDSSSMAAHGPTLIAQIRRLLPQSRLVLIGMEHDPEIFFRAVREGIVGYVLKDASAAEMVSVIGAVASGEAVCPPCFSQAIFTYAAKHLASIPEMVTFPNNVLSRREQQLVNLVRLGLTNKEIATRLNLSEYTVKNHMHRIFCKIGVHDRSAMVQKVQCDPEMKLLSQKPQRATSSESASRHETVVQVRPFAIGS